MGARSTKPKLDDLPVLPFEKILSYLSLEDRIRLRAVSRRWCNTIDSFRVKCLCCSAIPSGFIFKKTRLVSGAFAQNFISSARLESFFATFGQSILAKLKHLRLCRLNINTESLPVFTHTINSFDQLEELDLFNLQDHSSPGLLLRLNLPMLKSIDFVNLLRIQLVLDAPKLKKVRLAQLDSVDLVHPESVEWLLIRSVDFEVKKLKNLKHFYCGQIDSTLLSDLEQLKEIYLTTRSSVAGLFKEKQRLDRVDLKIFYYGCPLNGPDDLPVFENICSSATTDYLVRNVSRLADEMPFWKRFIYSKIESVAPRTAISLVNRFSDLYGLTVDKRVQDTQRFLDFMKNFDNIISLFLICDQSKDLLDQLPEYCTVQKLTIFNSPLDLAFTFRLKSLNILRLQFSVDLESIRKALEELHFLREFRFEYLKRELLIKIDHHSKLFEVIVFPFERIFARARLSNVNAVIQFIVVKTQARKQ